MPDWQELSQVPLHHLTERVQEAPNLDEKMAAFGDWLLRVVGVDGIHGADNINEVLQTEFGVQARLSSAQLLAAQRFFGCQYRLTRNGELYKTST
jgi:hypothetical protein